MRALLVSLGLVACASTTASTTLTGARTPEAGTLDVSGPDAARVDAGAVDATVRDASVNPQAPAPRPVSPLSTARVTSRRPVFRWRNLPGETGAVVEVCADRTIDLALGVPGARTGAGQAEVYLGSSGELPNSPTSS